MVKLDFASEALYSFTFCFILGSFLKHCCYLGKVLVGESWMKLNYPTEIKAVNPP